MRALARTIVGVVALGSAALANRVHYDQITLEQLVQRSPTIVVAHVGEPPTQTTQLAIGKPDQKAPPFQRVQQRYVVDEVLRGAATLKGRTILVDEANFSEQLELHKRYYLEGTSKSPIYDRYAPRRPARGPRSILFLRGNDDALAFSADGAIEDTSLTGAVKKAMRRD